MPKKKKTETAEDIIDRIEEDLSLLRDKIYEAAEDEDFDEGDDIDEMEDEE